MLKAIVTAERRTSRKVISRCLTIQGAERPATHDTRHPEAIQTTRTSNKQINYTDSDTTTDVWAGDPAWAVKGRAQLFISEATFLRKVVIFSKNSFDFLLNSPRLSLTASITSLFCAVTILGESLTGLNIFGIFLVSVGPALLIAGRRRYTSSEVGTTFVPDLKRGILHGMVCVVGYGGSPILIVLALQSASGLVSGEKLVGTYLAGGAFAHSSAILLFSYIFASACVVVMGLNSNGFKSMSSMSREGLRWFLLSGFMIAVSQVFRYAALALAPVSVVVPIQRLSVIFRLLFNWYLNRQYERIEINIVIGIILSVFGAAALSVDTTAALNWLDPNPVIYSILNWRV